ncbi:MAG TPA: hypothetical protein DCZ48_02195, partial [Methylococcaceae bacterium]|nr:hypothetical protein [Methylococcaceae bacterium]
RLDGGCPYRRRLSGEQPHPLRTGIFVAELLHIEKLDKESISTNFHSYDTNDIFIFPVKSILLGHRKDRH